MFRLNILLVSALCASASLGAVVTRGGDGIEMAERSRSLSAAVDMEDLGELSISSDNAHLIPEEEEGGTEEGQTQGPDGMREFVDACRRLSWKGKCAALVTVGLPCVSTFLMTYFFSYDAGFQAGAADEKNLFNISFPTNASLEWHPPHV